MYLFGFIDRWARLGSHAPVLANVVTQAPGFAALAKRAANVSPRRRLPALASGTLQEWGRSRRRPNEGARRVILWPDTFSNFFEPNVGVAATAVLEEAGLDVVLPQGRLCCGRPLYDYGFLTHARRYLQRTLSVLRDEIRAGTPVVGLEPSCVAVFRDELTKMLPNDEDAKRLAKQTFHFAEFLAAQEGYEPPRLERRVLLQTHCHAAATNGRDPEHDLLERMGVKLDAPETGCCGMAGAWGYERGHYDVSRACGERLLLPAVRDASPDTLIVADGFSCRHQIAQGDTGRKAMHIAEALSSVGNGR
jgi:Fe-S oxidoreductase